MDAYEFDSKFQDIIAATIIRDHATVTTMRSVVHPGYFSDPTVRKIVTKAIEFHNKYRSSPSKEEFIAFCRDELDVPALSKIKKLFKIKIPNKQHVIDQMTEFAQYSAMKEAVLDSSELIGDYDNRVRIKHLIGGALKVGVDSRALGTDLLDNREARFLHRLRYGLGHDRVSTGIKRLDQMMEGGLDKGELGMVMAQPKGFKTGLFVNLAAPALAQRLKVALFTFEVSEKKYMVRMERRLTGLNKKQIVAGSDEIEKALRRIEVIGGGMVVKGYPMRSVTVEHINNHLDLLKSEGFEADIVFVDYWDLIRPSSRNGEYRHQLGDIGTDLRAMAQERDVPVWTG
ncbi:MAG: DnaB-like helicase C-terminal domain-containing protein, partial [Candidatus Thorarchaeota archaeon]